MTGNSSFLQKILLHPTGYPEFMEMPRFLQNIKLHDPSVYRYPKISSVLQFRYIFREKKTYHSFIRSIPNKILYEKNPIFDSRIFFYAVEC